MSQSQAPGLRRALSDPLGPSPCPLGPQQGLSSVSLGSFATPVVFSLQARIISWGSFRGFGKGSLLVRMEGGGSYVGAVPLSHFHSPCY